MELNKPWLWPKGNAEDGHVLKDYTCAGDTRPESRETRKHDEAEYDRMQEQQLQAMQMMQSY